MEEDYIRRYFIMTVINNQMEDIQFALNMSIGGPDTQRWSLDNTKLYIKTTQENIDVLLLQYPQYTLGQIMELTNTVGYTYEDISQILSSSEWDTPFNIN